MTSNDSLLYRKYWNKITIKAIGSKGNYLYNGIDNNLKIIYPDSSSGSLNVFLKVNNGKIFKTDSGYLTIPKNAGRSFISLCYLNEHNDTIFIGKKQLIVLSLPSPSLQIGQTRISDKDRIDRRAFYSSSDSLRLFFTDDYPESDHWYNIGYFMVGYSYGDIYISTDNEGPRLSSKTLDFIRKLNPGQEVVIKVNSITPSNFSTTLPLIRFKIL